MISKKNITLLGIYIVIFSLFVIFTTLPNEFKTVESKIILIKILDVDKQKLFEKMADVENYPTILPDNYVSIVIKEKNENILFTSELVKEQGIEMNLYVKHIIVPYESHTMEVLDGNAKGTKITTLFEEINSKTKITSIIEIRVTGILLPFGYLPESNLKSAMNTILDNFEKSLD